MKKGKWNYLFIRNEKIEDALAQLMESMNKNYPDGWNIESLRWEKVGNWYEIVLIFNFL